MAKNNDSSPRVTRKIAARQERDSSQSRRILLGSGAVIFLVIALVLVGVVFETFITPRQAVAEVKGEKITTDEFQTRVRYDRNQLVNRYYNTLQTLQVFGSDPQTQSFFVNSLNQIEFQLDPSTMGREVINQMIEETLIKQEAAARGITVSEEEIDRKVEELFGFFEGGYPPTPTLAPSPLPTSTLSPQQLAIITPTPTQVITATAVPTAVPEIEPTDPAPTPTPYTYEAYQTNYNETMDILHRDIRFTDDDLRKLAEKEIIREKVLDSITNDLSNLQEQVWARHILVEDLETAHTVISRLESGEDFGLLAQELSTDEGSALRGGDLGWFSTGRMVAEFETAAFALGIGEISDPIQSQFGFHIIQVLGHEDRPLTPSAFEQLKLEKFQEWLSDTRDQADTEIEIFDIWADRVPTEPSIPAGYTEAFMSQLNSQAVQPTAAPADSSTNP